MAIYDWPTGRAFVPAQAELRVIDNTQRVLESPLSGYVQTLSMPGARWGWGFDFTPHAEAERQAFEAHLLRLSGREHRVRLWDFKRPRPRGSIQASGVTLGAPAAQFASTLQLVGCRGLNHLLGGSFEIDSGGDGLSDGWSSYLSGATGAVSYGRHSNPAGAAHGSHVERVTSAALGTGSSDQAGFYQAVPCAHLVGQPFNFSAYLASYDGAPRARLHIDWYAGGIYLSSHSEFLTPSSTLQRYETTGNVLAGADTAYCYVWMEARTGSAGVAVMDVDAAQFVTGTTAPQYPSPATLLAGDWLGLATGQLVRVVANATATEAGVMTVEVRHMLRTAAASGSAVTLEKPTALFVRGESGIAMPRQPGLVEPGMSQDFIEVFA